ncbi:MAG: GrdX family protein [Bacillota bacterium]
MTKYIIISNNLMLKRKIEKGVIDEEKFDFVDCKNLDEVMTKSRDKIHKGYILISHPLAGSVKPAQNPYRSIILKENDKLDFNSLKTIEKAIEKLKQFQKNKVNKEYPPEILEDYQVIDYSLISSGIKSL